MPLKDPNARRKYERERKRRNYVPKPPRIGPCQQCGQLFSQRGPNVRKWCSAECRKAHHRDYCREWERRTHRVSISYWRVAPTPEAQEVARLYFELRQALRGHATS